MNEYLVIYEEDDDGTPVEDRVQLEVHSKKQWDLNDLDVHNDLEINLENTSSRVGISGLLLVLAGAAGLLGVMVAFSWYYPGQWYNNQNIVIGVLVGGVASVLLLIGGVVLTTLGRRVRAHGRVTNLSIYERS